MLGWWFIRLVGSVLGRLSEVCSCMVGCVMLLVVLGLVLSSVVS